MPSWASQDFVMAFLRKLKEIKGSASVEVYGMPQWENFESIEPDYLNSLHVHISKAAWVDYSSAEVKAFQQRFFEASGTIPDEDGFNGYDVTWFTGKMLGLYGLSFVQRLQEVQLKGFRGNIQFKPVYVNGGDGGVDYYENGFVHILRFDNLGYVPVVND